MYDDLLSLRALDAEERLELLRNGSQLAPGVGEPALLAEWRSHKAFDSDAAFAQRLRALGVNCDDMRDAIALAATDELSLEARAHVAAALPEIAAVLADPHAPSEPLSQGSLLALSAPLLRAQLERFERHLDVLSQRQPQRFAQRDALVACARDQLGRELHQLAFRTCTLELHVAKLRERIAGDTPEARYVDFVRLLGEPAYRRDFFAEYQGLWRLLALRAEFWLRNAVDCLDRLAQDAALLAQQMQIPADLALTGFSSALGDSHRRGRSVVRLSFGESLHLMYKPRSVAAEAGFAQFIEWFNAHSSELPLHAAEVLDRGDYGWCRFVSIEPVPDAAAAARFFRRQGMFLAVFYALSTSDLHHENLIAHGEHPVYIDLETLFHSHLNGEGEAQGDLPADARWPFTVADTFLLPGTTLSVGQGRGADLSPLGAGESFEWPVPVDMAEAAGTDEMRIVRRLSTSQAHTHRPRLDGALADAGASVEELRAGFRHAYRVLLQHREWLLGEDGFERWLGAVAFRQVVRPTVLYHTLLEATLHPDYQRDWTERRIQFERLWPGQTLRWRQRLFDSELADLQLQDVPYFTKHWTSHSLFDSIGRELPDFFCRSARDLMHDQFARLSETDLLGQLRLLDVSFRRADPEQGRALCIDSTRPPLSARDEGSRACIAAARLTDLLAASAIDEGRDVYWQTQTSVPVEVPLQTPALLSLYEGQIGIVWQLGVQARISGDPALESMARRALDTVLRWVGSELQGCGGIGAFDGAMSLPYVLTNLGVLWNERALIDHAFALLANPRFEQADTRLDIVAGSAGAILVACGMEPHVRSPRQLELVRRRVAHWCGQLLAAVQRFDGGLGWVTLEGHSGALTGYSHGGAGIAAALAQAALILNRSDVAAPIAGSLAFERAHFDGERGNWRDLRQFEGEAPSAGNFAWCHGAPGMIIGRAQLLDALARDEDGVLLGLAPQREGIVDELERAVRSTQARGVDGGHCLCHGCLGNGLSVQSAALHSDAAAGWLSSVLPTVLDDAAQRGWHGGDVLGARDENLLYAPGFMTGTAGIAYGLLAASQSLPLPNVLALEVMPATY